MFSRANPFPALTENRPRAESDPAAVEEDRGRIVAEPERPAVQPGQVAGLRRQVAHLRQVLGEQLRASAPVLVEVREQRVQPRSPRKAATDASTPRWPACSAERSVSALGQPGLPAPTTPHFSPAMFQLFDAEQNAIAALGAPRRATGRGGTAPVIASGAWTSSETTVTSCWPSAGRPPPGPRANDVPVGLCGRQSR